MRFKPGVDASNIAPALWLFLGAIADRHRKLTGESLVITSLRRPPGPRPSLHSPGPGQLVGAADLRRWTLDEDGAAEVFCRALQASWPGELQIVLEPEWLTEAEIAARGGLETIAPHIHVELGPGPTARLL